MWYLLAVFFAGMLNIVGKQTPDNITSNAMAQYQMRTLVFLLLDTIQEPLSIGFKNTPYFNESDNFSTFGGCSKFQNFQNLTKLYTFYKI